MKQKLSPVRDIHKLPTDGYFVLPLSMSRLHAGQDPKECYKIIEYFEKKVSEVGIDLIFLYTNGLYYNNTEPALDVRKRTNAQMLSHRNALLSLIKKGRRYIPQAMHFIPWDYVILNTPEFEEYIKKLQKLRKDDSVFSELLREGLKGREENEANINFLIEEIVVSHLIREKLIEFPKTLVKKDTFRLIMYPGIYFKADLYQWKKKVLPQKGQDNPYSGSHYDSAEHLLYNFDEL